MPYLWRRLSDDIVCNVEEFESLSEKCYDTYNANVIHVLEDPEINNKSAVLCW